MRSLALLTLSAVLLTHQAFAAEGTDPKVRAAAQRGVDFLSRSTAQWVTQNNCFGCHVEAVTLEGLAVGRSHQYQVNAADLKLVLKGILDVPGGARTAGGVSHPSFTKTARLFAGSAFARHDALVDATLTDDLLQTAKQLLAYQEKDGSVVGDYHSAPVAPDGVLQSTFQAAQTWRQAYGRTGDDRWLPPLRQAEAYFVKTAKSLQVSTVDLQTLDYTLLGLMASGASGGDAQVMAMVRELRARQAKSGGFGFSQGSGESPFATGQAVYALRQAGLAETDDTVAAGLRWLVAHQSQDGSWGAGGAGKAEAMWAVLGLVSVDVMSVSIKGVADGAYLEPVHQLTVTADDNKGDAVAKLELLIDDKVVAESKTKTLSWAFKTDGLASGKHTIDGIATNAKGQKSRRRLEVFSGDVFFTQLGTRFTNEGTQVAFRSVHTLERGRYALKIHAVEMKDGTAASGATVYETSLAGSVGPLAFVWSGTDAAGKKLPGARYFAEVAYVDGTGKARQSESVLFLHAGEEAEKQYARVSGSLGLKRDGSQAANAEIDLVDDQGRVVQQTRSNEQGNYMLKSVDPGKYKIRVRKDGFAVQEIPVQAAPAAEAKANSSL